MSVPPITTTPVKIVPESVHLQSFIELVYIKQANDMLVAQMASLESALATTKSAMDTLTQLQNLHNLATVKAKGAFPPGFFSAGVTDISVYKKAASAFFGTPVGISGSFSPVGDLVGFQRQMQSIITQLNSQIAALSATTPLVDGRVDSNSLYAKLITVKADASAAATNPTAAIAWIVDKYNLTGDVGVVGAGKIQQNLTNAITAGQSLNTTQTESVRNFLYLFEEYYKSASAVLQAINQIIQKMADGIAR